MTVPKKMSLNDGALDTLIRLGDHYDAAFVRFESSPQSSRISIDLRTLEKLPIQLSLAKKDLAKLIETLQLHLQNMRRRNDDDS